MSRTLCDLVESKKDWSSSKNTYLMTSERLAQEVLMTVGRGIVNEHLACGKKVPEKWLSEKSKLHKEMAFDLWERVKRWEFFFFFGWIFGRGGDSTSLDTPTGGE